MAKNVIKNAVKNPAKNIPAGRPVGVTILAVLGYIGAAATLLMGLVMIFGSAYLASLLSAIPGLGVLFASLGTVMLIVTGIIFLPLAVLDYFIARGLWNGKNWARIIMLVFGGIGVLQGLFALPGSIVGIAIDGVIIWYLGFYKPAVAYFK